MDTVSPKQRSQMMAGIRSKDTKPEILIRKGLFELGYRYRLHNKKLPGKPDLCLKKYNCVIFVNGCFWHAHTNCLLYRLPKSKIDFWKAKLEANRQRDQKQLDALLESGWRCLIVWECALKGKRKVDTNELFTAISSWIQSSSIHTEIRGIGI